MTISATESERLVDLVVSLSGRSGPLARRALDAADPGALAHDPLAAVAAALVTLRRDAEAARLADAADEPFTAPEEVAAVSDG